MTKVPSLTSPRARVSSIVLYTVSVACGIIVGGVQANAQPIENDSGGRMGVMRTAMERMHATSNQAGKVSEVEFNTQPILRFGDATRQTVDGTVWSLGKGRPQAIVAMELTTNAQGEVKLHYEFLCLTDQKLRVQAGPGWIWTPRQSEMQIQDLVVETPVHRSAILRRRQMKQLASRFSASEFMEGEDYVLRMLPNPVVSYKIEDKPDSEGAVFAFSNGTNPEVLLFIESYEGRWRFGLARLCGASPTARMDGKVVWTKPSMHEVTKEWSLPYTGDIQDIDSLK
ncbi:hypothetical protein LOC67_07680 [Stieleria sp. JC731]|uniref:hypothetical protein n=1 Tax=Pirellulaceae TaxID=2691357 RepID=UPI001E461682|nr:hypothetical protein [Stieleria sp. JC731]MCC9600437.1 hypothetical protein [Stieleria sp. JC731]